MEKLIQNFQLRLNDVNLTFKRYLWERVNWQNRLIAIVGARGVGKTSFLLQHIKENLKKPDEVIYVSLDDLFFAKNTLSDFTRDFVQMGGKYLFLDEVHKYPDWSVEVKNIYDKYQKLHIVITGSSALNIHKGKGDLSRRIVVYKMNGLSFREFIKLKYDIDIKPVTLREITDNGVEISRFINEKIKPLKFFKEYLEKGYYPFIIEGKDVYYSKLEQAVNELLESDLPALESLSYTSVFKLKKLLSVIAELVPFKPNILKLSRQIGISRDTLLKYLVWLHYADLLLLLSSDTYGISKMNKPEKIYLNNTNLSFALTESNTNSGMLRETFFYNQLNVEHKVFYNDKGDFNVDKKYNFEIGGKNKTKKQIADMENAFVVADNIEYAYRNTIPLWLFGMMY